MKLEKINYHEVTGSILLVLPKYIGDAINTTPTIGMLRALFPDKKIILLVRAYLAPLFERDDRFDVTVLVDHRYTAKSRLSLIKQAKLIKSYRCELAIVMRNSFSDALLCWLSGIHYRIGYRNEGRSFLLTHAYYLHPYRHYLQRYAFLANEPFGRPFEQMPSTYLFSKPQSVGKPSRQLKVGVYFGGKNKGLRHYPSDLGIQTLLMISAELNCKFWVFGDENEAKDNAVLVDALELHHRGVVDFSGKTSLIELVDGIASIDVLLTIDSGPLHMAAAVDTPYVAIVGLGTSPWSMVEPKERSGVSLFANGLGLVDADLIRNITPERVLAATLSLGLSYDNECNVFQTKQCVNE
ncbi:glycosyltransferase family 9 protein [uncultured Shewanella sp.]|uniref:glycosyltransferase family 9 protein n=1 Tax=uncultured Shewanella sp. TaxID=173975 RepID=UPI00262DE6AF|nr:glycosyltransferase family 9 protein [uncultured Shewanella sp.]